MKAAVWACVTRACVIWICAAAPLLARPVTYILQPEASRVTFAAPFGSGPITGRFPIRSADVVLDFDQPSRSRIAVRLSIAGAEASFPFAAEAMKGATVLDARSFPEARFESTAVQGDITAAKVTGKLTLRGVTRPVTLKAEILRQRGTEAGDLSRLTVHLTGRLKRSDFGATGWAGTVGDAVDLDILARIARAGG